MINYCSKKKQVSHELFDTCCKLMAPEKGFEPSTLRLTAACSTIELPRNTFVSAHIPLPTTIEIILYCVGIVKTFCNYFFTFCLTFLPDAYLRSTPAFSSARTITGIITICRMIPGTALIKAPAANICHVKDVPIAPYKIMETMPHTIRPPTIAVIRET